MDGDQIGLQGARPFERDALRAAQPASTNKNLDYIGPLDPLLVGQARVVYERGERPVL